VVRRSSAKDLWPRMGRGSCHLVAFPDVSWHSQLPRLDACPQVRTAAIAGPGEGATGQDPNLRPRLRRACLLSVSASGNMYRRAVVGRVWDAPGRGSERQTGMNAPGPSRCELVPERSARVVCEGRRSVAVAGGRLPPMALLYSRAVQRSSHVGATGGEGHRYWCDAARFGPCRGKPGSKAMSSTWRPCGSSSGLVTPS
jgi:hypothetical protein